MLVSLLCRAIPHCACWSTYSIVSVSLACYLRHQICHKASQGTCSSLLCTSPLPSPSLAGASIGVLAKIESAESVEHLEEILDAVDGAMVARGDLGAELPVEEVPYWQNLIVQASFHPCEVSGVCFCIFVGCIDMRLALAVG